MSAYDSRGRLKPLKIPNKGYCVAFHQGSYIACFKTYVPAVKFARTYANALMRNLDIVAVSNRGEERNIVEFISPSGYSR